MADFPRFSRMPDFRISPRPLCETEKKRGHCKKVFHFLYCKTPRTCRHIHANVPCLVRSLPRHHVTNFHDTQLRFLATTSRTLSGITRLCSMPRTNFHTWPGFFSFPQFRLLRTLDYSLHAISLILANTFRTCAGLAPILYNLSHSNSATLPQVIKCHSPKLQSAPERRNAGTPERLNTKQAENGKEGASEQKHTRVDMKSRTRDSYPDMVLAILSQMYLLYIQFTTIYPPFEVCTMSPAIFPISPTA